MEFHYTYLLICNQTQQKYIGVRTSKYLPEDDPYMSSSSVVKKMRSDGFTFKKEILAEWSTREEAMSHEIFLHECFDVAKNPEFLNKAKQTSTGFDPQGRVFSEEEMTARRKSNYDNPDVQRRKVETLGVEAQRAIAALGGKKMGAANGRKQIQNSTGRWSPDSKQKAKDARKALPQFYEMQKYANKSTNSPIVCSICGHPSSKSQIGRHMSKYHQM